MFRRKGNLTPGWHLDPARSSDIDSTWYEVDQHGKETGNTRIMRAGAIVYTKPSAQLWRKFLPVLYVAAGAAGYYGAEKYL